MKMTPVLLVAGSLMVFWASTIAIVLRPVSAFRPAPSDTWRAWTPEEAEGHALYVANGCHYCHSQYVRTNDWGLGSTRLAQAGDYVGKVPIILGSERTGPDLSQVGGEHPDDWHLAHFENPRFTSPVSLMPSFGFLGEEKLRKLTAFLQSQGGTAADGRVARQDAWRAKAQAAFRRGPDANVRWLHAQVPEPWRAMPNPYPAEEASLLRGKKIYQDFCIGCHGAIGDGRGPAAEFLDPPPLNFTELRKHLVEGRYIGGILYYQIMNGITGTAMPYFKRALESAKIWDVSNYVAVNFIGYTDGDIPPKGIDAAYEPTGPVRRYEPPDLDGQDEGDDR